MSNEKNNGGPAFPTDDIRRESTGELLHYGSNGMTLRDYMAAKAMQALIAKLPVVDYTGEHGIKLDADAKGQWMQDVALSAYDYADRMLKAREL